jgi:hypothetical protein
MVEYGTRDFQMWATEKRKANVRARQRRRRAKMVDADEDADAELCASGNSR